MAHKQTLGTGITNGDFSDGQNWIGGEVPVSGADWFTIKTGDSIAISSQTYSGFSPPTGQVNTVEESAQLTISINGGGGFALGGDFYNNGSVDIPYPAGFSYSGGVWHGNLPSGLENAVPGGFQVAIEGEGAVYFWHYNSDLNGEGFPWDISGTYAKPVVLWYGGYQYGGYSGHIIAPALGTSSWANTYCTWWIEDGTTIALGASGNKYHEEWNNGNLRSWNTPTVHSFSPIDTSKAVVLDAHEGGQFSGNIDTISTISGSLDSWVSGIGSSRDAGMLKFYGMGGQEKALGTLITSQNVVCSGNVTGTVEFTNQESYGRGGNVEYRHSRVFNTTIPKGGF